MISWIKGGLAFVKQLPEAFRIAKQLHELQLQAKDATIESKEARIELLEEKVDLERNKAEFRELLQNEEIKKLRSKFEETSKNQTELAKVLVRLLEVLIKETPQAVGRYAEARTRITMAHKFREFYLQRRKSTKGLQAMLLSVQDSALASVIDIRLGSEQMLLLMDEFPGLEPENRKNYSELRDWAAEIEKELSKSHQLPSERELAESP